MKWDNINELCGIVRQTSFAIHKYHRNGQVEKVCENALVHHLRMQGLNVEQQFPLAVYDEAGTILGEYFADLFVENRLIIELKACRVIADEHVAQILGYLRASPEAVAGAASSEADQSGDPSTDPAFENPETVSSHQP